MTSTPIEETPNKGHSLAANLTRELSRLEKRDWELWLIVALSGIVGGCPLLCLLFPTFFQQGDVHFEIVISRRLFFFVVAILTVLNTYVASRRAKFRQAREKLVAGTIQSELVRLQSFADPLTEGLTGAHSTRWPHDTSAMPGVRRSPCPFWCWT